VISLYLGGNDFNYISGELDKALAAIPASVTSLDLAMTHFSRKTPDAPDKLAQTFKAIPASVTSLNLCYTRLQYLSVEELNKLSNALPGVQTLYLEKEFAMTPEQRTALKAVFPNVQNIILLDQGNPLGGTDLEACHYFASKLGLSQKPPTLKSYAAFFVKHNNEQNQRIKELPEELQVFVNKF
jgi:hypothetical protein